jgi:cytochrome P450
VGGHFATLELVLVLATLCQRIQVEPVPGFELELLPLVTLRPSGGLPLRVRRRGTLSHVAAA